MTHTNTIYEISLAASPALSRQGRQVRRARARERIQTACRTNPTLDTDRVGHALAMIHEYACVDPTSFATTPSPLVARIGAVKVEVATLQRRMRSLSRAALQKPSSIFLALTFLKTCGRLYSLDYTAVPPDERALLVRYFALEYAWCFCAAQTTPRAFKRAIGRTGAR